MTAALTIAHLSDVHLGPIRGFSPRYWNLKRLAGYWNWHRNRRHAYQRPVLDRLVADMWMQAPGHLAITGDLANIGLPQEHIDALAWLESLGPPDRITVIPGNHDIYSRHRGDPGTRRWSAYMASDRSGEQHLRVEPGSGPIDFPLVRILGNVALIGLNSAVPTPPLIASGRVGEDQLAHLADILGSTGRAGLFRLVLVHHPPLPGQASHWRGLRNAAALQDVLHRHGAELVIHGHNHLNMLALQPSCTGRPIPVVGVPSASLGSAHKAEPLARYNLYRIEGGPPWTVELLGRGLAEPGGPIVELERRTLAEA